ncbi:hypothetical protein AMR41_11255, partial [Hapalosiphon sp. MRB220]
ESAIAAYESALEVYTREAFPQDWATTQNNLGIAYGDRILGERANNLESAIAAYESALEVRTREAFPQQWATTQNNLGNAYLYRILGERANNLESAIAAYESALEVRTREAFPQQWATTQNNLGNAYLYRILGERANNLESAIAAYQSALEVYTRQAFPQDWAATQNNLGTAYSNRILGERANNLESAIAAYESALEVYTREAFPQQWAGTQNNLGNAYSQRILGERANNLESAITAYQAALQVRTLETLPQNHAETLYSLGIVYQEKKQYTSAYNTFESAIETVESLRGEIVSGEESKRKQAEEWNKLYRRMVEVCLALKEDSQAIEFIERSKTRNLVELLFNEDCYPKGEIPAEVKNQLQELQQKIAVEKRRLEAAEKNQNQQINRSELHNLRQQREQLMSRVIGFNPIRFNEIQNLLDDKTAIIEWYIFGDCFRAFIITSEQDKPKIWHSQAKDLEELRKWTGEYLQLYSKKDKNGKNDKGEWRYYLYNQLTQLAKHLHIDDIVSLVPSKCQKIILVPHLYLHLLPLHALQLTCGEYLIDKFPGGVSYAPSCQLLRFAKNKSTPPRLQSYGVDISRITPLNPPLERWETGKSSSPLETEETGKSSSLPFARGGLGWGSADNQTNNIFSNLFAIQNPTADLEFTDIEVETIANTFHPHQILKHSTATKAALDQQPNADNFRNASWLHFSCHGYFNFTSPLESGLQLADTLISPIPTEVEATPLLKISDDEAINLEKCLTLENIFNLSFPNCRLVTLSACESGLVDFTNTSDEYIGLPSGFIKAGAANIVSSLWAVDDFATAILMMRFYENLQTSIDSKIQVDEEQKYPTRAVAHPHLAKGRVGEGCTSFTCEVYDIPLALNQAQKWFREVTQEDLILWIDHKTEMDAEHKRKVKERLEQNYLPKQLPFKEPCFWAAFCAIGE